MTRNSQLGLSYRTANILWIFLLCASGCAAAAEPLATGEKDSNPPKDSEYKILFIGDLLAVLRNAD